MTTNQTNDVDSLTLQVESLEQELEAVHATHQNCATRLAAAQSDAAVWQRRYLDAIATSVKPMDRDLIPEQMVQNFVDSVQLVWRTLPEGLRMATTETELEEGDDEDGDDDEEELFSSSESWRRALRDLVQFCMDWSQAFNDGSHLLDRAKQRLKVVLARIQKSSVLDNGFDPKSVQQHQAILSSFDDAENENNNNNNNNVVSANALGELSGLRAMVRHLEDEMSSLLPSEQKTTLRDPSLALYHQCDRVLTPLFLDYYHKESSMLLDIVKADGDFIAFTRATKAWERNVRRNGRRTQQQGVRVEAEAREDTELRLYERVAESNEWRQLYQSQRDVVRAIQTEVATMDTQLRMLGLRGEGAADAAAVMRERFTAGVNSNNNTNAIDNVVLNTNSTNTSAAPTRMGDLVMQHSVKLFTESRHALLSNLSDLRVLATRIPRDPLPEEIISFHDADTRALLQQLKLDEDILYGFANGAIQTPALREHKERHWEETVESVRRHASHLEKEMCEMQQQVRETLVHYSAAHDAVVEKLNVGGGSGEEVRVLLLLLESDRALLESLMDVHKTPKRFVEELRTNSDHWKDLYLQHKEMWASLREQCTCGAAADARTGTTQNLAPLPPLSVLPKQHQQQHQETARSSAPTMTSSPSSIFAGEEAVKSAVKALETERGRAKNALLKLSREKKGVGDIIAELLAEIDEDHKLMRNLATGHTLVGNDLTQAAHWKALYTKTRDRAFDMEGKLTEALREQATLRSEMDKRRTAASEEVAQRALRLRDAQLQHEHEVGLLVEIRQRFLREYEKWWNNVHESNDNASDRAASVVVVVEGIKLLTGMIRDDCTSIMSSLYLALSTQNKSITEDEESLSIVTELQKIHSLLQQRTEDTAKVAEMVVKIEEGMKNEIKQEVADERPPPTPPSLPEDEKQQPQQLSPPAGHCIVPLSDAEELIKLRSDMSALVVATKETGDALHHVVAAVQSLKLLADTDTGSSSTSSSSRAVEATYRYVTLVEQMATSILRVATVINNVRAVNPSEQTDILRAFERIEEDQTYWRVKYESAQDRNVELEVKLREAESAGGALLPTTTTTIATTTSATVEVLEATARALSNVMTRVIEETHTSPSSSVNNVLLHTQNRVLGDVLSVMMRLAAQNHSDHDLVSRIASRQTLMHEYWQRAVESYDTLLKDLMNGMPKPQQQHNIISTTTSTGAVVMFHTERASSSPSLSAILDKCSYDVSTMTEHHVDENDDDDDSKELDILLQGFRDAHQQGLVQLSQSREHLASTLDALAQQKQQATSTTSSFSALQWNEDVLALFDVYDKVFTQMFPSSSRRVSKTNKAWIALSASLKEVAHSLDEHNHWRHMYSALQQQYMVSSLGREEREKKAR
eukprot:PhM_4_TR2026/c0_g1_i1/m.70708